MNSAGISPADLGIAMRWVRIGYVERGSKFVLFLAESGPDVFRQVDRYKCSHGECGSLLPLFLAATCGPQDWKESFEGSFHWHEQWQATALPGLAPHAPAN